MKAVVLVREGQADQAFELRDIPKPSPASHEVLIKVSHFGLNFADVMSRNGKYNDRPELPCVLGYEVVGTIEALGSDVSSFSIGDRVVSLVQFGGYAEYAAANSQGVLKLGDNEDAAEATALATQYCTAWLSACMMINLRKGDRVLIHAAAGGVGTALVQIAKWKECEIFGTASQPDKMDYLREQGVDHPINYKESRFEEEVQNLLGDKRLDAVFDPVGGANFKRSLKLLGSGGRIVTFGASDWASSKGSFIDKLRLAFGFGFLHPIALLMKAKSVIGVNMLRIGENRPDYVKAAFEEVMVHYRNGTLKPTIDSVHHVEDIQKAHELLENRSTKGKVVVRWN